MIKVFENHEPVIAASAWIDETAVVIGDVHIGDASSVWPLAVARGDIHSIRIGDRTNIQDGSILHVTHDSEYSPAGFALQLGNDITIGHQVVLHGCTIHDKCLVGMGSVVMDGAVLDEGVMLGAGSLVTPGQELHGGYLWHGRPARQVRQLTDREKEYLIYAAAHYVRLADRYRRAT
jgi:carbonic anhydrase/acetyltransferase-like protein (isoleucine patch superfamily)